MAKKGAFKGWPHAYDEAVDALRRGELIGVFPEGTVSRSFEVQPLKAGAARLAQEAGVPLIPVAVWGAHRILTKGAKGKQRERLGGAGLRRDRRPCARRAVRRHP